MTPDDLRTRIDEIEQRHKQSSFGCWDYFHNLLTGDEKKYAMAVWTDDETSEPLDNAGGHFSEADAYFITEAHNNDVPFLIAQLREAVDENERLRVENEQLRKDRDSYAWRNEP